MGRRGRLGGVRAGRDRAAAARRRRFWQVPGRMLQWGPIRFAAWPAYQWVAAHRHMLPGGTAACSLPQAERDKLYGTGA